MAKVKGKPATDWTEYRAAPKKVIGMKKAAAIGYLEKNGFPYAIAKEDGKSPMAIIAIVMLHLHVQKGIVVGADLDGDRQGTW